jgi:hypothetical protein
MIDRHAFEPIGALGLAAVAALLLACSSSGDDLPSRFPDGSLFRPDSAPGGNGGGDGGSTTPPADANTCITQPCDLHEQCGCATGQACDVDLVNIGETACRGVSATFGGHADACVSSEDCRPGFRCVGAPGDLPSFCRRYCQEDADCPGIGAICLIQLTHQGEPIRDDAVMCTFHCNATQLQPSACPEGHGCYISGGNDHSSSTHHTRCLPPGELGHGQRTCEANSDCQAGHTCVIFSGEGECRRSCIIGASGGCGGDLSCQPFGDPKPTVGNDEYGFCG